MRKNITSGSGNGGPNSSGSANGPSKTNGGSSGSNFGAAADQYGTSVVHRSLASARRRHPPCPPPLPHQLAQRPHPWPVRFLLTPLDRSPSAVLGYSWLHLHNPSINWVMHEIMFRTPAKSSLPINVSPSTPPSVDALHSTSPCAKSESYPSVSWRASAAKIPISVISSPAIRLLSRLPSSHPSSILCSCFVSPSSTPARSASSSPDAQSIDPELNAEYDDQRHKIPETLSLAGWTTA